jgi:PhoH-like ATPase
VDARKVDSKEVDSKKKVYVLDTNVLIHDPRAFFTFKGAHVVLPLMVIQELDQFKTETSQRGRNAREVIRLLDKIREHGSLSDWAPVDSTGTFVRIVSTPPAADFPEGHYSSEPDDKILATALFLRHDFEICFVTKDLNMRVRADALGLCTLDYKKENVAEDDFYKGWVSIPVPAGELQDDHPKRLIQAAKDYHFAYNEFVLLQSERNQENYRIFRFDGEGAFHPVKVPKIVWPIMPRNPQQLMALDLLFDDNIQLVTLFGPAGTGKTLLVLVAAMHKLLIEHQYKKILIARPIEPLGRDIGYLPGDLQEKLFSWMQPVRDNMDFLISKAQSGYERGAHEDTWGVKHGERKSRRGGRKEGGGNPLRIPSVDELTRLDKLSLEAITYMRGRSIPDQFILIDEVQNLTPHEVKTIVTRVGEGSKIILAGDPYQIDSPYLDFSSNGLVVTSERFKGQRIFGSVYLERSERSELSNLAAQLL